MAEPVRLRLSRTKRFSLQAMSLAINGLPAVNVARPSRFGNQHVALVTWYHGGFPALGLPAFDAVTHADAMREGRRIAVATHRHDWLQALAGPGAASARAALDELRGRNLACWCPLPEPGEPDCCHAATYLELANA